MARDDRQSDDLGNGVAVQLKDPLLERLKLAPRRLDDQERLIVAALLALPDVA